MNKDRRLPEERGSFVHRFTVGKCKGYLISGTLDDGSLGEIFVKMSTFSATKLQPPLPPPGLDLSDEFAVYYSDLTDVFADINETFNEMSAFMHGMMNILGIAVSVSLQHGVPLRVLVDKFIATRFPPSGRTSNPNIRVATSLVDYIFRYLKIKFLNNEGG